MDPLNEKQLALLHKDLWIFSCCMLLSVIATCYLHDLFWIACIALVGNLFWVGRYFLHDKSITFPYGPANAITILRCCLLITITILAPLLSMQAIGMLLILICIGDFLDGRLARALNMTSTIGEYMDKETDALFVLFASMILYFKGVTGIWIILLGLIRYVYFIFMYFRIKPDQKEIKVPAARTIAVVVFLSLLLSFFIPKTIANPILMISCILLIYSFGLSTVLELRHAK